MAKFKFLTFLFLVFPSLAFGKVLGVNGGVFIQTKSVYRGALTWNKPSFFIGPSFVFHEKFFVRGPNLSYQFYDRKSSYRLNLRLSIFNDQKPIFDFSDDEETIRNSRSTALDFEVQFAYKFGYRKSFEVGATVSKDFIEHKAFYFEPQLSFPVAPFTKVRAFLGSGGRDMNAFLYGSDSDNVISHYGFSLSTFLPSAILPRFFPGGGFLLGLEQTSVAGSVNRKGVLLDGARDNLNFSIRYFCKFF